MVCWDVEGHGCLGFHMGGMNISGRIKQSFYPRTRHVRQSYKHDICSPLPDKKIGAEGEVDRTLASSPTVTPRAHKTITLESRQRCTTITREQHKIKKATQYNALRHRTYRPERLLK